MTSLALSFFFYFFFIFIYIYSSRSIYLVDCTVLRTFVHDVSIEVNSSGCWHLIQVIDADRSDLLDFDANVNQEVTRETNFKPITGAFIQR